MKQGAIRVIIVDDHQMVRETWKMLLHTHPNIQVIKESVNGEEAIADASTHDPHVMLMDINMPLVNGFEATKAILEDQPDIKIIGISINNQPSYARNLLELGAKGYVTKNSSRDEMIFAIEEVMQGKTYVCREVVSKMKENPS